MTQKLEITIKIRRPLKTNSAREVNKIYNDVSNLCKELTDKGYEARIDQEAGYPVINE